MKKISQPPTHHYTRQSATEGFQSFSRQGRNIYHTRYDILLYNNRSQVLGMRKLRTWQVNSCGKAVYHLRTAIHSQYTGTAVPILFILPTWYVVLQQAMTVKSHTRSPQPIQTWYQRNYRLSHPERKSLRTPLSTIGANWLLVAKGGLLEGEVLAMEVQLNSVVMVNHVNGGVKSQPESCEEKVGMVVRYDGSLPRQLHRAQVKENKCQESVNVTVSQNCLRCARRDEQSLNHSSRNHEMSWLAWWSNPRLFVGYFTPCFVLLVFSCIPFFGPQSGFLRAAVTFCPLVSVCIFMSPNNLIRGYYHTTDGRVIPGSTIVPVNIRSTGTAAVCVYLLILPSLCYAFRGVSWHGEQNNEGAEPSPVGTHASDAVEKRRKDKMLIARMLDMDEPFMTEKVRLTENGFSRVMTGEVQAIKRKHTATRGPRTHTSQTTAVALDDTRYPGIIYLLCYS